MPVRPGLLLVLLTGCPAKPDHEPEGDGVGESSEGSGAGETAAEDDAGEASAGDSGEQEGAGGDAESCLPPLDAVIEVHLGICKSTACDDPELGLWAVAGTDTGKLTATCTGASGPNGSRSILEGCSGDAVPTDGRLAIDWRTDPAIPLSLPAAEPINIQLDRSRPGMVAWTLRNVAGELIALRAIDAGPPEAAFSAPLAVEIASTFCEAPPETCIGERLAHELLFDDGDGHRATLGWGGSARLGSDPGYDVLLRQALSFPEIPCGEYSDGGFFSLVIARAK